MLESLEFNNCIFNGALSANGQFIMIRTRNDILVEQIKQIIKRSRREVCLKIFGEVKKTAGHGNLKRFQFVELCEVSRARAPSPSRQAQTAAPTGKCATPRSATSQRRGKSYKK